MKCIEPILGLRIYFDETDQGNFYTSKVAVWSRSDQDKMIKQGPLAEKSKMTRQDAIEKIEGLGQGLSHKGSCSIVNALEALGLLKFEEEKKENTIYEIIRKARNIYSNDVIGNNKFMQELYDNGYRIVKLGDSVVIDVGSGIRYLGSLVDSLLRERLANLRQFLTEELASRNYSDLYASDLKSEIKILERQLKGRL